MYSEYQVQEERLSSPRWLRLTSHSALLDASSQRESGIPLACVWQPLAELPETDSQVPLIISKKGPVRCSRCFAYANPFFIINDRQMTCNLCNQALQTPAEFFSERELHKELTSGTCDFKAPDDYCTKPAPLNVFLLCIDVSAGALAVGLPQSVLTSLKVCAAHIPHPERSRVAIMTYADTFSVYRPVLPLYEVVSRDTDEPFLCDPMETLTFALDTQMDVLVGCCDALIERLNAASKPSNELISPGALITAAKEALGLNGGRVLLFASGLGTLGLLSLKQRDETKLYNTDRERELFVPQHDALYELGRDCSGLGITVDYYGCAVQAYLDVASVYPLVSITGGDLHLFSRYAGQDAEKLHFALVRTLTRQQAFQVQMRVRVSSGLTVDSYIGHYHRKGATDMEVSILDADKSFAICLKHEERLKEGASYYIQAAMLYTNIQGERLIRVFNTVLRASSQVCKSHLASLYSLTDVQTLHNVLFKQSIMKLLDESVKTIRDQWHSAVMACLLYYRQTAGSGARAGQMVFPEGMGILPLLTIATMKQAAFSLSRVGPDLRMACVAKLKGLSVTGSFLLCYPRVYSLHDLELQEQQPGSVGADGLLHLPNLVPAAGTKLLKAGVYLVDNGQALYLIIGPEVAESFLNQCFGVAQFEDLAVLSTVPELESELNQRLLAIIEEVRRRSPGLYQPLIFLPDSSPTALQQVRPLLVEDATPSELSYADYLMSLNRALLSKLENS